MMGDLFLVLAAVGVALWLQSFVPELVSKPAAVMLTMLMSMFALLSRK